MSVLISVHLRPKIFILFGYLTVAVKYYRCALDALYLWQTWCLQNSGINYVRGFNNFVSKFSMFKILKICVHLRPKDDVFMLSILSQRIRSTLPFCFSGLYLLFFGYAPGQGL